MRLLFSVNNFGFLRNFEPALRLLAARGHDVHLVAERRDTVGGVRTIENLTREHPDRITFEYAPSRKDALWQPLAVQLRLCLDYWRYLDPRYDHSPSLRARAERQAPGFASALPRMPLMGAPWAMAAWRRVIAAAEKAMPPGGDVERFLRERNPDLLLMTPLLYFGSQQVEYVRAAKALGIPTVLGVGSWDHLTTKGLIHEQPDHVLVWNEFQKREAEELHGLPPEQVTVTGAQAYDHWFLQRPSTTAHEFATRVGLPVDRPILLYLCSSPFITPYEVAFVRRWIDAVRTAADPVVRGTSILIRPHPQNAAQWTDFDESAYSGVAVWPRGGANPVDRDARADYFDAMYHSVAVVGINTSALIESGIVGRPVFSVLTDEFAGQQEGTLHFQHLKNANGGLLHVASTLDQHVSQLAGAVLGRHDAVKSRAFVGAFVRPLGLHTPAAEQFVRVVEAEAAAPRRSGARTPLGVRAARVALKPVAAIVRARSRSRKAKRVEAEAPARRPLRLLFVLASPEYLRYYDSTMKALADRGHHVMVGVNWLRERKHARLHLVDDARIEVLGAVPKRTDLWTPFARAVRGTMDFARYLHPRFADAPLLRARMYRKVLPPVMRPLNRIRSLREPALARVMRVLQACERAIPISTRLARFLEAQQPDAVIVSPLIDSASDQVDTVRAAKAAGIPVVAAIASWDNLTNKGHMRVEPDLVAVWNEYQKQEAAELHGVSPDRIALTGAQLFDRWFERQPSQSLEAFCAMVGLPEARRFVLFTGSSVFIARSEIEVPFVRRWIEALRANEDPVLRSAPVLVRPHPFNGDAWSEADFRDLGPVAIWPRQRYTPADDAARTSFFDSLYYSAAVVGINTSAMIEAAILRKPVLSLLTPEFAGTQEGTLHFRYLLPENGGFLRVANSIDSHTTQLAEALAQPDIVRAQTEHFIGRFLRPHGLERPCTPILADTLERAASLRVVAERERLGTRVLRVLLWPMACGVRWLRLDQDWRTLLRRWAFEVWAKCGRTTRIVLKRTVIRPVRLLVWAAGVGTRKLRRLVRLGVAQPARRALRLVRLARYHAAMRLRGEALGGDGPDGQA